MNPTTNYTSLERYNILYRANEDTFRKLIPTISFCSVLACLGVAGNMLSIHIFVTRMLKNQQNDLFILLSVFNLLACGVCLPLDILDMRNMYLYPSNVLCKMARFLNMFTMASSTLTLCVLAIFRLRAASSRAVVIPQRRARFAGLGILVLLSGSVSWLAAVVFGIRSSPTFTEDITGRDCSIADAPSRTAWPVVFNVVLAVGFFCLLAVTTAAYYRIWRIVKKSRIAVTAHTMTVGVSLGRNGQRKLDMPCYENNVTVSSDDIKERKTDSSSRKDNHVNIYSDDINELRTILSPQEVNNGTNKISIGQEKCKQSTQLITVLILANGCTDTAPANVSLSDDNNKDIFTPMKENILLITDMINNALITADGTVNNELLNTDGMTMKSLLNTDGTANNRVLNITNTSLLNACDTANNALVNNDVLKNVPLNTDSTTNNDILKSDDLTKDALPSADVTENDTPLNTDSTSTNAVVNKGVVTNDLITTDGTAKIHTRDGSCFVTSRNVRSTLKFGRVTSSVVCRDMDGDQVKSRVVVNTRTEQLFQDNPDCVPGYLCKNTCNPNSNPFLYNKTKTSNIQPHSAYADKCHSTIINSIAKDIFSTELKTTSSTGKEALNKSEKAGHELKQKLSKTSLEAAVTRTAFLLTLTFIVSYLPFFFVSIPRAVDRNFDYSQDALMMNLVNTVLRLYFIMPVVSPAIFWASNLDFRRQCKAFCSKNNSVVN